MPAGNGHVTAMVNYESANNSIAVLVSAASSWLENGETAKVGLLHISLPSRGGAAIGAGFKQTFNPQDATIRISIPSGGSAPALEVVAYVDASSDTIVLSTTPSNAAITASWQALKPQAASLPGSNDCQKFQVSADVIASGGAIVYHRNTPATGDDSYMVQALQHTNVKGVVDGFGPDPMTNRTTGAMVAVLPQAASTTFAVSVLTANTDTAGDYVAAIAAQSAAFVAAAAAEPPHTFPPPAHNNWWAGKWAQHSIEVSPSANASQQVAQETLQISQQYVWQRFIELSQARSPYPIKFNGMLYGAKRPPNQDNNIWGGLNWWQNLRMPYYNMLPAGDTDEMKTLFAAFNKTVPIARQRTRSYFGFEGIWWPEYTQVFYGTPHPGGHYPFSGYRTGAGCTPQFPGEPDWHSDDKWNGYNRQGSLDLSLMILDHWAYTGEAIPDYLAIPIGVVEFYANLWGNTTASAGSNGKMTFYPTQALETWQCPGWPVNSSNCPTNDMPTIAGLHAVLEKLVMLPPPLATSAQIVAWTKIQSALPALPTIGGKHAPCDNCVVGGTGPGCHHTSNGETAELYSVHPYRQATIARAMRGDGNEWAKANLAFNADPLTRYDAGWNQNAMTAALLGNATMAATYVVGRALTPLADGYRFPGFAPRVQDAAPSGDHYAVFATALQYMLIQRADDAEESVLLLPAWPCHWDVNFTVNAPKSTTITGRLKDGVLQYAVTPSGRASAVRARACQVVPVPHPPPPPPPGPPPPPPGPPGKPCDYAAWHKLCQPSPPSGTVCMQCCSTHKAQLFALNCIGPNVWPDYCEGKGSSKHGYGRL